jgi:hypothetical protein
MWKGFKFFLEVATCGILFVLFYKVPQLLLGWRYQKSDYDTCDLILILEGQSKTFVDIQVLMDLRYFEYKKYRFVYNSALGSFNVIEQLIR